MHKNLEKQFGEDERVVFIYAQTVFEGFGRNSYEAGIQDLKKHGVKSLYAFDPGDPGTGKRSSIMSGYLTGGTPWSIVIDPSGVVRYSGFTRDEGAIREAIEKALATAGEALPELNEADARALATRQLAKAMEMDPPTDSAGKAVSFNPSKWQWLVVERKGSRWELVHHPPAGLQAKVTFDLDGQNPKVQVDFADD